MANVVQASRVLHLSRDFHQELYTFIQIKWECFKCFVVFKCVNRRHSFEISHILNKQIDFFDKNVSIVLPVL